MFCSTAMAKSCRHHRDCETTQACSQEQCINLCFCDNCNKGVNNARDWLGETPLHRAAMKNSIGVANLLLENSANVDSTDNFGGTALHKAAWENSVAVASLLIENSADVDRADNRGQTALHKAVYVNSVGVAKVLIENSADLNATVVSGPIRGLTPLQVAERFGNQE